MSTNNLKDAKEIRFLIQALLTVFLLWLPLYSEHSYKFVHLSVKEGLSQSTVTCILQDYRGLMWFGTEDGLNKYDGYKFEIYTPKEGDSSGLNDGFILSVYEDSRQVLWVGTEGGAYRFNRDTNTFTHYTKSSNGFIGEKVWAICEDSQGDLWFATSGSGLNRWDHQTETFKVYQTVAGDAGSLISNRIKAVFVDSVGALWVGTEDSGLERFDRKSDKFIHYRHNAADPRSISSDAITSVSDGPKGHLWVGTNNGLNRLAPDRKGFTRFKTDDNDERTLSHNVITRIHKTPDNELWVGTEEGLNQFNPEDGTFIRVKHDSKDLSSLGNDLIRAIYESPYNVLWVGTEGGGISNFAPGRYKFTHYQPNPKAQETTLKGKIVYALHEDPDGYIWIGTDEGLNRFDRETRQFIHYQSEPDNPKSLSENFVMGVTQDREGVLWLGTWEGGLNRFDPESGVFTHYKHDPSDPSSISCDIVRVIYEDSKGELWVGTWVDGSSKGGLNRFDRRENKFIRYLADPADMTSLSDNKINSIEESPSGELWVGTEDGLNRFNPQTGGFFHYRKSDNGLNDTSVLSIHVSSDGTVWIGTGNGGLNKLNPVTGRFEYYRKRNGLPNNMVYGIVEDHQGKLWLSTNNGLCQFDPKLESYHNYYERDGLQSNEFNTGTFLKCRNGELAFGGPHGFNLFHPDKIKKNDHIPNIILTDFKVLNQDVPIGPDSPLERHISESNVIHLTHNDYEFSFEFAALDYYYSPANKYMVKLEGFDKEWVDPGNRRFKSYTTLDPGEYVFRVIGSNNDREWNKKGTSVRIIIKPPYWQTWWFQTFGGLFLVLLVLVLFRARTNSIRNRSKYLEEMNTKLNRHITERKKAEAQLKKSERRLRTFLETASEGFLEVNRQGIIMDVNPEMGSILGRKRQELMGRPIFNFIDPEGSKTVLHHMELRRAGERNSYELGMFKPDKSVVHCLINAAPLYDKEKKIRGSFAMVTDITDIIKAEEKLMRTKDYLNDVFDSLSSMLISVDRNGIITQWNRAAEKYIGIPANDAIAKKIWDVVPFLGDYRYHLGAVLESRQPVELHKESLSVSEKDKKFLDIFMYPLGYSDLEGVVIRLDDVTEMEKKDRQLIQAQKMEIVGNLAGGLAHDFNNVLGGILGTTSLLQFSFEMDDEFDVDKIKNRIDTIEKGAERAVDLVKQLLTLSRKREPTLTPVNLNQSLKNVLKICRNTFDKSIIITTHCVEEKAMVRADATQMEQVMLNLCINASHAMTLMRKDGDEPGGRLALSISPVYPDRIFRSNHPTATEDSYWSLEVEDTGVGIDAKTLDQVFDPFFTTKSERKGTGLGLAMVYHIVEQHHGVLAVYSEPGQGTTFQVLLPRAEGESVVLDIKKPEMTLVNGSGLILVVDDELNLRETSSEILASCGYRVMTAEDGEHGVSVYTEKHPEISAVLLDMAMPKMSGKEAYLEMKKINPAVKVLLTSGFKQDSRVMDVMNLGVKGFIQKPFSMVDLSRKMFDVVNS